MFTAPSTIASVSVICTAFAPAFARSTAPVKLFPAVVRVITPAPELKSDVPETERPEAS